MFSRSRSTRCLALIPVAIVLALFLYCAVMYDLYFLYVAHSTDLGIAVSCGVLFHGFFVLALWAYFRTLLTEPGFVSEEWQIQAMEEDLGTLCRKCQAKRPVRAHHCGTTGKYCFLYISVVSSSSKMINYRLRGLSLHARL